MEKIVLQETLSRSGSVISVASGLYATPKDKYIEQCRDTISKMKKEIASLEKSMTVMGPAHLEYASYQKKIAKRQAIIKDCEQGIFVMQQQMNLQTHERFRGL